MEPVPYGTEERLSEYLYRQLMNVEKELTLLKAQSKPKVLNFNYSISGSIVDADPTAGFFRIDNANWGLATNLYFDNLSANGADVFTAVRMMKRNDEIVLQDSTNSANRIRYRTGNLTIVAGYFKLAILAIVSQTGVKPAANTYMNVRFVQY